MLNTAEKQRSPKVFRREGVYRFRLKTSTGVQKAAQSGRKCSVCYEEGAHDPVHKCNFVKLDGLLDSVGPLLI